MKRPARALPALILFLVTLPGCAPTTTPTVPPAKVTATATTSPTPSASSAAARPPACSEIGQRWTSPADGTTLVCVPAGTFQMGAAADDAKAKPDAQPRHDVRLSAFWIDRTEVTNAEFAMCVAAGICAPRPTLRGSTGVASKTHLDYYDDPAFAHYPVLIYTPEDAATYCSCMARRLPTEAEWEHAAGGPEAVPPRYPWGDTLDCDHASYLDCTADTTDVGLPLAGASGYGALNMAGNVAEWVSDFYAEDFYAASPVQDPTGPTTGEFRVRRGGGFSSLVRDLVITARQSGNAAHYFDGQMGFRCAATAGSP